MSVAVVHNGDRIDLLTVDANGNCRQQWTAGPGQGWTDTGTILTGCVANTAPVGEWNGGNLNVWVQGTANAGCVRHWWYDGNAHSETIG